MTEDEIAVLIGNTLMGHVNAPTGVMFTAAHAILAALSAKGLMVCSLCSDCPPVGYPTDETRCLPCPRRPTSPAAKGEG